MTYGEYKQTEEYLNAEDVDLCINGEEPIDEMYYPEELDHIPVLGIGSRADNTIQIDLIISNWKKNIKIMIYPVIGLDIENVIFSPIGY